MVYQSGFYMIANIVARIMASAKETLQGARQSPKIKCQEPKSFCWEPRIKIKLGPSPAPVIWSLARMSCDLRELCMFWRSKCPSKTSLKLYSLVLFESKTLKFGKCLIFTCRCSFRYLSVSNLFFQLSEPSPFLVENMANCDSQVEFSLN